VVLLDHVFVCTSAGAPAAARLRELGLIEGTPNRHPGQGTACRRFFFHNAMLELLWVEDEKEAREEAEPRLKLWERWSASGGDVSRFGISLRPARGAGVACPFAYWEYRPATMPGLELQVAANTALAEPMWCFMPAGRHPHTTQPHEHPNGWHDITTLRVWCPRLPEGSVTRELAAAGIIDLCESSGHLLEIEFDDVRQSRECDLQPDLPVICRW